MQREVGRQHESDELMGLNVPASPAAGVPMEGPGSSRGRESQGIHGAGGEWLPGQEADSGGNVSNQPYGWGNRGTEMSGFAHGRDPSTALRCYPCEAPQGTSIHPSELEGPLAARLHRALSTPLSHAQRPPPLCPLLDARHDGPHWASRAGSCSLWDGHCLGLVVSTSGRPCVWSAGPAPCLAPW